MSELGLKIDDFVFEHVPDYRRVVVVGIRTGGADVAAIQHGLAVARRRWESDQDGEIVEIPAVRRWRNAFRRVGLNPTRTRPAAEALIRRARHGRLTSFGNAYVDLGAIVSLMHVVPVGMHAIDGLDADLVLTRATGLEEFLTFSGTVEHPSPGELIWRSGESVLTRHWVHQQGSVGSVGERSSSFFVNLDLLGGDALDAAVQGMVGWLGAAGVSVTAAVVLDQAHPCDRVELPTHPIGAASIR